MKHTLVRSEEIFWNSNSLVKVQKGKIIKVIRFSEESEDNITYFNLGFGDYDPETGKIDDLARSNNLDQARILTTVANSVIEFTRHFPDKPVFAMGSTPARTRLYQIGIASNWDEIDPLLHIFGFRPGYGWEPFRKNISYSKFFVKRKQS